MKTAVKERPILFSGPMVRAILRGGKTQTRRVIKPQPNLKDRNLLTSELMTEAWQSGFVDVPSPYNRGTRLWVRETWQHEDGSCADHKCGQPTHIYHKATESFPESMWWRPSIFMPRWACRLELEIEEVRVQRLHEISEEDAIAEGVDAVSGDDVRRQATWSRRQDFAQLWDRLNKKRGFGWDRDPFVWAITFRRA